MQAGLRRFGPVALLGVIALSMIPLLATPQMYEPGRYGGSDSAGVGYENPFENPNANGEQTAPADSVKQKERKPRRPLESYFFDDSIRMMPNFMWNVSLSHNRVEMQVIDTALLLFQVDYPFQRKDVGDAFLGNLGGATIPFNYFRRPQFDRFAFTQGFYSYLFTPETAPHYNVKNPFTHLNYGWAGQKRNQEENFQILHAQNISPSTGFNISYKSRGTRGIYAWQGARAKNLSVGFSHTGKKYSAHAGYIYNSQDLQENGGMIDTRDLTDTIFELARNIPMRMGSPVKNVLKNNAFYAVQSYGVPLRRLTAGDFSIADRSSVFVGHSIVYSRFHKKYNDTWDATVFIDQRAQDTTSFYRNWFLHPEETRDSIFESLLSNRVFVQLQPYNRDGIVGTIDAGAGYDLHRFYLFSQEQYRTGNMDPVEEKSIYVYGAIEGKFREYIDWGADLVYHPDGYRSQDLEVGGKLALSLIFRGQPATLSGRFRHERRSADYWSQNYFSNHYIWSNSFDKENETRLDVTLDVPQFGLELGAHQSVVNNKVYYDQNSLPRQSGDGVSVTGVYARKDFRLGGFHLNNRVMLQWSTAQEVIPVPLATAFLSWFYEFDVVRNVLRMQAGLDGRYNTSFYSFAYNPALATFYNQREKEVGNYPMIDVFVNAKWKRMRIMMKLQHANDDLFGTRNYFHILRYPLNQRIFKIGFSWTFYD